MGFSLDRNKQGWNLLTLWNGCSGGWFGTKWSLVTVEEGFSTERIPVTLEDVFRDRHLVVLTVVQQ